MVVGTDPNVVSGDPGGAEGVCSLSGKGKSNGAVRGPESLSLFLAAGAPAVRGSEGGARGGEMNRYFDFRT